MKKENNPIQDMLNQIYNEKDLGEDVFDFVNPHIMNAYGLIEAEEYNKQNNQPRLFNEEEDLNNLKNILYRDLPSIFTMYTALPIKYRNTNKLKTGKTHRETLLENMESLVNHMISIENLQYEGMDRDVIVKTKVFDSKYSKYSQKSVKDIEQIISGMEPELELQKEVKFENKFNYDDFKKTLSPEEFSSKEVDYQKKESKNIHIEFHKGIIEYKVKDKMKTFMKGVYQAGNKFINDKNYAKKTKLGLKIITAPVYYPLKGLHSIYQAENGGTIFCGASIVIMTVAAIPAYIMYDRITNHVAWELKDIHTYSNAPTPFLKEINMTLLNEYAQKHPQWFLSYKTNEGKDIAVIDIKSDMKECKETANKLKETLEFTGQNLSAYKNYKINNKELPIRKELTKEVIKAVCSLPQNTIHMEMDLTQYSNNSPKPKI